MAFTERYVTSAAAGGGDGSSGTPWTLAEAFANATAGDRVNIQSDSGYSIGATTITNAGTTAQFVVYRGYNSTIGDLEGQGRTSNNQALDTTNFPAITVTGLITVAARVGFEALSFSGALSSELVGGAAPDRWFMTQCKVVNSQSNSNAQAVAGDNECTLANCDFECSGALSNICVDFDDRLCISNCRVETVGSKCIAANTIVATNNILIGDSSAIGIQLNTTGTPSYIINNTAYQLGTFLTTPNGAPTSAPVIINNHVTDCSKYIDNLYSATANVAMFEFHNRTRDNTTPRTGVGDGMNIGEITTDTGGASTDYTDVATDDYTLISTAPGKAAGVVPFMDCGALQREEPAGGSSAAVTQGIHAIESGINA